MDEVTVLCERCCSHSSDELVFCYKRMANINYLAFDKLLKCFDFDKYLEYNTQTMCRAHYQLSWHRLFLFIILNIP